MTEIEAPTGEEGNFPAPKGPPTPTVNAAPALKLRGPLTQMVKGHKLPDGRYQYEATVEEAGVKHLMAKGFRLRPPD